MDYQEKMKYARDAADQLRNRKSKYDIQKALEADGLYDRDIASVISNAQGMLTQEFQPLVEQYLNKEKQIHGAEEFSFLSDDVIDSMINQGRHKLATDERKRITEMMKSGQSAVEVFTQVDTRFLSVDKARSLLTNLQEVKKQNSGQGRVLNIAGGIGLIALTGILAVIINRIFYVLPIIGIVMIVKGITTKPMTYDN